MPVSRPFANCTATVPKAEKRCFGFVQHSNRNAHAASDSAERKLDRSSTYDHASMAGRTLLRGQQNTSGKAVEQQRKLSVRLLHYTLYDASQRAEERNCIAHTKEPALASYPGRRSET